MKRTHAVAIGLVTMLMTTAAHAGRPDREEVQAPRGQEVQAPRDQDEIQAPRGQDIQAPRGQDRIETRRHER